MAAPEKSRQAKTRTQGGYRQATGAWVYTLFGTVELMANRFRVQLKTC
jgi:hypothetical protein